MRRCQAWLGRALGEPLGRILSQRKFMNKKTRPMGRFLFMNGWG